MSFVTMELAREIENDRTLEQLTNKIKKIIPEIEIEVFAGNKEMRSSMITVKTRPITLEDMLRCLGKIKLEKDSPYIDYDYNDNARILFKRDGAIYWQLGKPLHEQSEETLLAIIKLFE